MQKISGTAALLILAALLDGPNDLAALGETIGIRRYQTLREAAQEAVAAEYGLLLSTPGRRLRFAPSATLFSSLLLPGLASPVFLPPADAEGGRRAWDRTQEENKEIDTSIYRRWELAPTEGYSSEPDQIRAGGQNEAAVEGQNPNEQKVFLTNEKCSLRTESVLNEQKVFVSSMDAEQTESVRKEQKVFVSEEKQAPDFSDDLFWRVEAADALPAGRIGDPHDPVFMRRRKAQMTALAALWKAHLPGKPTAERTLTVLLREADGEAIRVADMVLVCAERGIEHPFSYIQAALRRQAAEREARSPRAQTWEYELEPMTEDFAQQLADAASVAKQLWED